MATQKRLDEIRANATPCGHKPYHSSFEWPCSMKDTEDLLEHIDLITSHKKELTDRVRAVLKCMVIRLNGILSKCKCSDRCTCGASNRYEGYEEAYRTLLTGLFTPSTPMEEGQEDPLRETVEEVFSSLSVVALDT